jgi:hypothetical protein
MTPEQIQHYVGFGIAIAASIWLGHFVGYMRGYRAARLVYAEPPPLDVDIEKESE